MKVIASVVLAVLSVPAAAWFYWAQPIYLIAFALAGLALATYVGLMAQLIGKRLPAAIFLSIWAMFFRSGRWF